MIEFDGNLNKTTIQNNEENWMSAWLLYAFHDVTEMQEKILKKITKGTIEISTDEIPFGILMENVKAISSSLKKINNLLAAVHGKKR